MKANGNISRRQFVSMSAVAGLGLALAGCGSTGGSSSTSDSGSGSSASGKVYYLNFKPEVDSQWQELAKAYTKETGVEVSVVTAASDTYEQKLQSEMSKSSAPTLFQVNGPIGLKSWKDYCADLTGTDILNELTNDNLALKDGDKVLGIDYVEEDYGIIYNKDLLTKAGYKESDITSFDTLKKVADDIQARKDELGVKGAFTSAGMDSSSNWRYTTHLANMPIYYEFVKDDEEQTGTDAIKGTYLDNYKQIYDLYITDSTTDPAQLASKTGDDANNEFVNGEAVFYQNGSWAWADISKKLGEDKVGMLPIYIGVDGEEKQGLCSGGENYWCVNSQASEEDQKATLDFLKWVVTSDTGTKSLASDMGLNCPFKSAKEPDNPFSKIAKQMISDGKTSVNWDFVWIPSEQWKSDLSNALTKYAAGTDKWDAVKTAFVDGWKTESEANAE
jgi:raffinose/stachyose/melibiose transport system substrate-binding protein